MRARSLTCPILAALFALPHSVHAQGSTGSVSASLTVLRDTDAARTYERGVAVVASRRLLGWVSAAAEASLSTDHEDFSSSQGGTYDFRYLSLHGGPRLSPRTGRVQPYAEVLAGLTRAGIWERRIDRTGGWASPQFSLQPGGGVDVFVSPRVAVRLGGDLRLVFRHDNRFDRNYRSRLLHAAGGLALHFGR